jgi:hypothetical protein
MLATSDDKIRANDFAFAQKKREGPVDDDRPFIIQIVLTCLLRRRRQLHHA